MTEGVSHITVFFDGGCPLCVREIALLRKLEENRGKIVYEDISDPSYPPSCDISKKDLLARFHCRKKDGTIVDGAEAFTEAWSQIPAFIWLRPIGQFKPSRWLLNQFYALFLKVRPSLQNLCVNLLGS